MCRVTIPPLSALFVVFSLIGCSPSVDPVHAAQDPGSLARTLVAAVQRGDEAAFQELLTTRARKGLTSGGGFDIGTGRFENAQIGEPSIDGTSAEVPMTVVDEGMPQELTLLLREEAGAWRMYGMRVQNSGQEMTIDLEQLAEMMESLATQMSEGMSEAFAQAQRDHAEREIRRHRKGFEALRAMSRGDIERGWRNHQDHRGQSTADALADLIRPLGLEVAAGDHTDALTRPVTRDVRELLRMVAIELLCQDVGVEPVFPGVALRESVATPDHSRHLTLAPASGRAVAHAGPFRVSLERVDEYPPHGRGALEVAVEGYGMDDGLLALLDTVAEKVTFHSVNDVHGRSLLANEGTRYIGGGTYMADRYADSTRIDLKNLLRNVEQIATVDGVQRLVFPLAVSEVRLDDLSVGARVTVDSLVFSVREAGALLAIEIHGPEQEVEELLILSRALDRKDRDIQVHYQDVTPWRPGQARYQLQAEAAPARLHMKVVTRRQVVEYPFRLSSIPLSHSSEMPEQFEAVDFQNHGAPVEVTFQGFQRPQHQLPVALLKVRNRSNKAVEYVTVQFHYLDPHGQLLDSSPHTINATRTGPSPSPLVDVGASGDNPSTAFFMPEKARDLRLEIQSVHFMDGTIWNASADSR